MGVFNFLRGGGVLIHTFFHFFPSFSDHFQLSHEKEKKAAITKQEKITAHLVAGEEVPGFGVHLSSLCPLLPLACPHPQGKEGGSSCSRWKSKAWEEMLSFGKRQNCVTALKSTLFIFTSCPTGRQRDTTVRPNPSVQLQCKEGRDWYFQVSDLLWPTTSLWGWCQASHSMKSLS